MLSWWSQWRAKDAYTRVNRTYNTSTHPTPRISPFSASQSFRPWLPFPILFKGCGEEIQQSNSVWVAPKHQVSQAYPASNPTLNSLNTNHYIPIVKQAAHGSVMKINTARWHPQTKGWTQLKSKRWLRVVLGPSVAKTTQQQPKKYLHT